MVLQDYKIDGEYITISKKELERWKARYPAYVYLRGRHLSPRITAAVTVGMQSVINYILKMFETSEKWDFNMRSEFPADARDAADIEGRMNRKE